MNFKIPTLLLLFLIHLPLLSQNITQWSAYNIAFNSPSPLQKVEETLTFIDFDNENLAVTIETTPLKETQLNKNNSIRVYAENIAKDLGFKNIVTGESLSQFSNGYFIQAEDSDIDTSSIPVFIAIILFEEFNLVFKVVIYCYHKNQKDGFQILRSLHYL